MSATAATFIPYTTLDGVKLRESVREEYLSNARYNLSCANDEDHPVAYSTLEKEFFEYRKRFGKSPEIPENAFKKFTPYIARLARESEKEIRELVEDIGIWSLMPFSRPGGHETILCILGEFFGAPFLREKNPLPDTSKNIKRVLRKAILQFNEQAAHVLHLVGKKGNRYASRHATVKRVTGLAEQARWMRTKKMVPIDGHENAKAMYLSDCVRTFQQRFSELYTLMKGQEEYFLAHSYRALFITLTAPARYHPSPANGRTSWDGSTAGECQKWFYERWQLTRALLHDAGISVEGVRVAEAHKDGTPHWHGMLYVKPEDLHKVKITLLDTFAHSPAAVKIVEIEPNTDKNKKEKASPTTYMTKYILKTISTPPLDEKKRMDDILYENDLQYAQQRVVAWRAVWGIRSFQFFGVLHGKISAWREMRRISHPPVEPHAARLWRAARGGRGAVFIGILREPNVSIKSISVEEESSFESAARKRIIGIKINEVPYITRLNKYEIVDVNEEDSEDSESPSSPTIYEDHEDDSSKTLKTMLKENFNNLTRGTTLTQKFPSESSVDVFEGLKSTIKPPIKHAWDPPPPSTMSHKPQISLTSLDALCQRV
jgi:hypothetical protein